MYDQQRNVSKVSLYWNYIRERQDTTKSDYNPLMGVCHEQPLLVGQN